MSEFEHRGRSHDFGHSPPHAGRENDAPGLSREYAREATAQRVSADVASLREVVDQTIARCTSKVEWARERGALSERASTLAAQVRFHATQAAASNDKASEVLEQARATLQQVSEALARERTLRARPPVSGELDLETAVLARNAPALTLFQWAAALSRKEGSALKERFAKHDPADHFANELHNFLSNSRIFLLFEEVLDEPSKLKKYAPRLQKMQSDGATMFEGTTSSASPAQVASDGVADANESLPHVQTLQPLFGRHDLSNIRAHVGGAAGEAASALGAKAFATEGRVGFASAPDLHTAAHEAAHVIQQQGGVALKAEVDAGSDDPHEQHADAVADGVVRGEHVEHLLDRGAPSTTGAVVHRKRDVETNTSRPTALAQFLNINEIDLREAVTGLLRAYGWPDPAPDVRFAASGERIFSKQLLGQLMPKLTDVELMQQLVRPGDLVEMFHNLVDKSRGQDARAFGKTFARQLQESAADSLVERIGPQYRRLWSTTFEAPDADKLAIKHPMDALVAIALTTRGVVDLREMPAADVDLAPQATSKRAEPGRESERGHETDGGNATKNASSTVPSTQQLMEIDHHIGDRLEAIRDLVVPLGYEETLRPAVYARLERVARLKNSDKETRARYLPVLQFQHTQLIAISTALSPIVARYWPLRGVPDFALAEGKRHERDELRLMLTTYVRAAAYSDNKQRSTAILREMDVRQRQAERARQDANEVDAEIAVEDQVASTPDNASTGAASGLDFLARQRQARLDGTPNGRFSYEQQKALTVGGEVALTARLQSAEHALNRLQEAAREVYGDMEGFSRAYPQLRPLPVIIQEVGDHLQDVHRTWDREVLERQMSVADPKDPTKQVPAIQDDPNAPDDWVSWKARASGLAVAQQAFAKIAGKQDVVAFVNKAAKEIQDQRIVDAAIQLGVALLLTVTTGVGAAALGARAAAAIATEESAFAVKALALGADLTINVTINTAVQLAISQPTRRRSVDANGKESEQSDFAIAGSMLLENLLMDAFTRTLAAPLRRAQEAALQEGQLIATLPHLTKDETKALTSFKFAGASMAVEFVGGMASQWAAHRLTEVFRRNGEEISEPFALTVLQQGAAIGLGKFFHGQLHAWREHRAVLEHASFGRSGEAQRLFAAREAFYKRAKQLADSLSPDPTDVHTLLSTNETLLAQEHALLETSGEGSLDSAQSRGRTVVAAPDQPAAPDAASHASTSSATHSSPTATHTTTSGSGPFDGPRLAAEAGVRYIGDGQFALDAAGSTVTVEIRRTNGAPKTKLVSDDHAVIEVSRGLVGAEFETAVRRGLDEVPSLRGAHANGSSREDAHVASTSTSSSHETVMLAGDDQHFRAAALRAQPRPGYVDVVVHGTEHSFWLLREQADIPVDHRALATYLEKHGLVGARIRLISCETGKSRFAVAQDLANKLDVEVLAPSETVWINAHGEVGVGPRDVHRGQWHSFEPKHKAPPGPRQEAFREPPPMRTVDGSEVDGPTHVQAPRVDSRARVGHEDVARLSQELNAKVTIDAELHNGVEVRATRRKGLLGYNIDSVEIRVGTAALQSDVMAHANTIAGLRRYNGLLGKLKLLAERLFKTKSSTSGPSKFPPGSRGYVTEMELAKLDEMIDARHAQHAQGLIDQTTLYNEIAFLEGQIAFHEETLQSFADTGYLHDGDSSISVGAPDIGAVTREAQSAGYKLPGELPGVGAAADPNHYYYRRSKYDASEFELALKPSAPADASSFRARVVNGKFQGIVDGSAPVPREVIPHDMTKSDVVARLRETEGFGPYAEMLEKHGIASHDVIDAAVTTIRGRKNTAGDEVTLDWLRHEVKDHFRERVEKKLIDPALDEQASYRNMRAMLDGLSNTDRGNLAEVWYAARHAKGAKAHVPYQIERASGENAGLVEKRVTDLRIGQEAREVKDIEGKIDEEQLGAYLDVLRDDNARERTGIETVRYVFTKPEGAIANLELIAEKMDGRLKNRLLVEVFDGSGSSHVVSTAEQAMVTLNELKTKKTKP